MKISSNDDWALEPFRLLPAARLDFVPSVDLSEEDGKYVVKVEIPGMTEKDIEVSILGDVLVLKGEKKEAEEQTKKGYHRVERRFGSFERQLRLPMEVEAGKAQAIYRNGLLTIELPKAATAKSREKKIPIRAEQVEEAACAAK